MKFKDWLKQKRTEAGMSQEQLHLNANITRNSPYQYEKGVWLPLDENCRKIAEVFNVDAEEVIKMVRKERACKF